MGKRIVDNKKSYDEYYSKVTYDKKNSLAARYILYLSKELLRAIDCSKIKTVIDVGCGDGSKTYNLLQLFEHANVLGVDFSASGIEHAINTYKNTAPPRIDFKLCDAENADYLNNDVDMVTSFYVLEHIENWQQVVDQWVSSKVKYVLCVVPSGRMWRYDRVEHYQHFPKGILEEYFARHGYVCLSSFYWGFPFYHPITKIALDIGMDNARKATAGEPSPFMNLIFDILYFLYTRCTSRRIGGDFFGLFQRKEDK